MQHNIAIVANGSIENYDAIAKRIQEHPSVIAVDGGLHHCFEMQITPSLIVGDFDSFDYEQLHQYPHAKILKLQPDKDETDLEVALSEAFKNIANSVCVFGALGKRLDHTLYNLHLLCRFPKKVRIEDEKQTIFAIEKQQIIACRPGQILSLLPIEGSVKGITTKGLKWELKKATFDRNFMSISNECLHNQVEIFIEEGILICCLQR